MNTLAQRLRELRRARNLNQIDVARAVGVDRSHLSKIETGDDTPGRGALTALSTFFGVSLDWLVTGQELPATAGGIARTEDEVLLLDCWRALPPAEARPLLEMLRQRVAALAPEQVY
ncbi:MAG TPA: helix-turn-helix transcriptional regulator [Acidisoma sp.]|uniref:helix-turn-helix domain-containing protein n=1 Tax=Acidisoma sp. TaxID=1872115 RepID=UPI002C2E4735|nr:helix-turn-helix transcriptional regulator [Acidisoma sp.]HTI02067.1 helix-turn-helix transcriptional regulator [Acidisoma sp.]